VDFVKVSGLDEFDGIVEDFVTFADCKLQTSLWPKRWRSG